MPPTLTFSAKPAPAATKTPLVVAFTGLPSAGKSTAINAIIGQRILQSGVARTSMKATLVGARNVLGLSAEQFHEAAVASDDSVACSLLDLPGVADGLNTSEAVNFDALTLEWAVKADVVLWVSDARTAFITSHETAEFNRVRACLDGSTRTTGRLHQLAIVLTKFEHDDGGGRRSAVGLNQAGELLGDEDTTLSGCLERVVAAVATDAVPVFKFNAFARVSLNPRAASAALQDFVRTKGGFGVHNSSYGAFNLAWAAAEFDQKRTDAATACIIDHHLCGALVAGAPVSADAVVCARTLLATGGSIRALTDLLRVTTQEDLKSLHAKHPRLAGFATYDSTRLNMLASVFKAAGGVTGEQRQAELALPCMRLFDTDPATDWSRLYRMLCLFGEEMVLLRAWIHLSAKGGHGSYAVPIESGTYFSFHRPSEQCGGAPEFFKIARTCHTDGCAMFDLRRLAEVAGARAWLWGDEPHLCVANLAARCFGNKEHHVLMPIKFAADA